MKKLIAIVLCILLTLSLTGTAMAKTEINYWGGWNGSDLEAMQTIVNNFNESQDEIHVNLSYYLWADMFTKLITEYVSGEPADVMCAHPFEIGQYAEMGLYDADQVTRVGLSASDYSEAVWNGTFYQGVQYAAPLDTHMHGLFYNKDIFAEAGIEKVPETGDELIETALKLTVDSSGLHPGDEGFDKNNVVQYGLSFGMNHHALFQWCTLMYQQGEKPFTEDMTQVTFDVEKAEKASQWLQDLIYVHNVAPQGETSYSDSFANARAAMVIGGSWDVPKFDNADLNYGTALYPQVFDEAEGYWAAAHILFFPANPNADPQKQEAAVIFVNWLLENANLWADSGYVTTKLSTQPYVASLPNVGMWLDALEYANYMPAHQKASQLFSQTAPSPFVTAYSSMILEPGDVKAGTEQFVKDLNAILAD
jgi:multiple sugar transport system substrate-binding protein